MKLTSNQTHQCEDYPTRDRSSIRCGTTGTTDNRSQTCDSAREGAKVAHVESKAERSEERERESWRTHAETKATPEVRNGERGNRYWVGGATVGTGSRSKNHESEESTNCVGTFRQGRQMKVLNFVR